MDVAAQSSPPSPESRTSFAYLARLPPGSLASSYSDICGGPWPGPQQLPVVYHPSYNISFFGIERLHPFDACKFGKVLGALKRQGILKDGQTVTPAQASVEVLADVHRKEYLHKIHHHNFTIVQVTELAPLALLPNKLLQWRIIGPMKLHVGGTMLAAGLALERGWAINLGGGMHHASADRGMGWCPFDDIVLAVRRMRRAVAAVEEAEMAEAINEVAEAASAAGAGAGAADGGDADAVTLAAAAAGPKETAADAKEEAVVGFSGTAGAVEPRAGLGLEAVTEAVGPTEAGAIRRIGGGFRGVVLVIDLDAHQGNGVAMDKLSLPVPDLYILDAYNYRIFPRDEAAKAAIDIALELPTNASDEYFLPRLAGALDHAAWSLPRPDLVIYNAGTDVLKGDPLGRLGLSAQGVVKRDEMVWRWCRDVARAPVVMLLSGGYTRESAGVISDSIANLFKVFGLGDATGPRG